MKTYLLDLPYEWVRENLSTCQLDNDHWTLTKETPKGWPYFFVTLKQLSFFCTSMEEGDSGIKPPFGWGSDDSWTG